MTKRSWAIALVCALSCALSYRLERRASAADGVLVYDGGKVRVVDEKTATAEGFSVVDLRGSFVPPMLRDEPSLGEAGKQPFADIYRALADERFKDIPEQSRTLDERYLELYGIFPSFAVVQKRLLDENRHACHAGIDNAPLAAYPKRLWQLPAPAEGAKLGTKTREKREAHAAAVRVVQGHLNCDGLLHKRTRDGVYDMWTADAVRLYQRRHMIISWGIVDELTRAAFLADSRELDFRTLLRVLRERVVFATGIIEDGSASAHEGTVLGRTLDPPELAAVHNYGPLANGAPDRVSQATEVAAKALGWTTPEEAIRWLRDHPDPADLRVALLLPSAPAYHSQHMELRVEIDRGDVWYGFPYDEEGKAKSQPVKKRPTITVFAKDGDHEVALVRWSTTIGGWQPENTPDGSVGLAYKNSDVGPRVWRQVIATPAWLPPDSTPDAELVRKVDGKTQLHRDVVGPGFASAYGLAMMPLEVMWTAPKDGSVTYTDRGIRTHGSVSYRSILKGNSHGCHRLFNHLAIRMASFLVTHRNHVTTGNLPVGYMRNVNFEVAGAEGPVSKSEALHVTTRGFGYELTPPVPVQVLEGKLKGFPKKPSATPQPLPVGYKEL